MKINQLNTTALAYIGDAVYEIYVREHVLEQNPQNVDVLHKKATALVCANGQASAIKALMNSETNGLVSEDAFVLTAEERALVKRARNRKTISKPKNADPVTYKWATAFEALIGYLYLNQELERLDLLAAEALKIIAKQKEEMK